MNFRLLHRVRGATGRRRAIAFAACLGASLACVLLAAAAQPAGPTDAASDRSAAASDGGSWLGDWLAPNRVSGTLATVLMFSALSLAPALVLMTTSFVRIMVVLSVLRQAIGLQGLPSNQVLSALALFMTAAIMSPVWTSLHDNVLLPYQENQITWQEALDRAKQPVHRFMARQIERTGNADDVWLFLEHTHTDVSRVASYDDVPFTVLAPAFLLSELKTAFLIGFQIYLPFLVIDLIISAVLGSMGTVTLSPTLIALPCKLLLFVMVNGWHLVVGMLLESFA